MNLEIEVNTEVETIEVLKISISNNKNSTCKNIYLALENNCLSSLVEDKNINVKGIENAVLKESIADSINRVTIPVNVHIDKEKIGEAFINFVGRNKKENTTIENSDVCKQCDTCGAIPERIDAKYCYHCGEKLTINKIDRYSNVFGRTP